MLRKIEGRDVLSGRPVAIEIAGNVVKEVRQIDTRQDLPWVSSSLVDLQINGYGGLDVNSPDLTVDDVRELVTALRAAGTGYWVPTVITGSHEHISHVLEVLREACKDPEIHEAIPFAHLEGPFISPKDGPRGAHDQDFVRDVDIDELAAWQKLFPIGYITLSPHWDDVERKVGEILNLGIQVALGHTHADEQQIARASVAGASLATHLGNGCPAMVPRHPNFVWEQIADQSITAGLIADGHHLPRHFLETVIRAKGTEHCFLVSDSVALAGSPPGKYTTPVGGEVVLSEDGRLALAHDSRLLAGSAVSLADCVRFMIRNTSVSLAETFALATRVPGRIHGELAGTLPRGLLRPGMPGRALLWSDDLEILEHVW